MRPCMYVNEPSRQVTCSGIFVLAVAGRAVFVAAAVVVGVPGSATSLSRFCQMHYNSSHYN